MNNAIMNSQRVTRYHVTGRAKQGSAHATSGVCYGWQTTGFPRDAGLFGALRLTPAGPPQGAFTPLHDVVQKRGKFVPQSCYQQPRHAWPHVGAFRQHQQNLFRTAARNMILRSLPDQQRVDAGSSWIRCPILTSPAPSPWRSYASIQKGARRGFQSRRHRNR